MRSPVLGATESRSWTSTRKRSISERLRSIGFVTAARIFAIAGGTADASCLAERFERQLGLAAARQDLRPADADLGVVAGERIEDRRGLAQTWRPYRAWIALLLRRWLEAETGEIARRRPSTAPPVLGFPKP